MSLYMLILLGLVLTWEAHTCDGRPHSDIELSSNLIEKEEPVLRGGKNSISRADWKKMYRLSEVIRANKKLANKRREDDKKKLWKPVGTTTTSAPSEKPLYGGDQGRVLDQLHDQTGDDQPRYHSAVDGWIF